MTYQLETIFDLGRNKSEPSREIMEELKSCPFCRGKAYMKTIPCIGRPSGDDGYQTTICCLNCSAQMIRWAFKKNWSGESGIKAWNNW